LSANQRLIAIPVGGTYAADTGATASDDVSGNVTASISNNSATILTTSALNTPGTYTVTYSATDAANNTGTATQTVVVYAAGTFASQYSSIQAVGQHNGWIFSATAANSLRKTANFQWKLLHYFPAATNTPYLINANAAFPPTIKWGAGGVRGAADASLSPTVDTNGWYAFTLNEAADTGGLAKVAAADADTDGLPDEWEVYFGSQLASPTNNLNPGSIYNQAVGGTKTALQAYQTGDNPVADAIPPTIALAAGVSTLTTVPTNTPVALLTNQVVVSDNVSLQDEPATFVDADIDGSGTLTLDATSVNSTTNALRRVLYTVYDRAGNLNTVERWIAFGDVAPNWRKLLGPVSNTISTIGSVTNYGRIYMPGLTPGAGQVPNITAELGLISSNAVTGAVTADPSTWTGTGVWRGATYNAGFTGGDDEYQATIEGATTAPGTYYFAYRFKIGDGSWYYAGVKPDGTDGGPWTETDGGVGGPYGNGTLVVNAAQLRNVTFAVNMGVQRELGNFNPESDKVYLVGEVTDWGTGVEMVREGSTDVFKLTRQIEGALGTNLNYKFKSGAAGASNNGYEGDVNPDAIKDERVLTLAAVDSPQDLPVSFFNNEEQVRSLTFKVDMGVQISKGLFAHGDPIQVRFGDFNVSSRSLTREGDTTVYTGTFGVTGNEGSAFGYKFWRTNSATNTTYERVDAPRTNDYLNRSYTLGSNGVAATLSPTPFFSNDDGVGPVITLAGLNTVNLNVGDSYSDAGATAVDAAENTTESLTGISTVNTAVEGTYTVTFNALDAAGNAATAVTRTVIVAAAPGSTFAGWSGGATLDATNVGKYAIGGASSPTAQGEAPTVGKGFLTPNHYSYIEAIVRTDDSKLTITGESTTDLVAGFGSTGTWTTEGASLGVSQAGVPTGCERKRFIYWHGMTQNRMFMRLKATLDP
jgi:hypothetical protein